MSEVLSDERLMDLVERALAQAPDQRDDWLREACGDDAAVIGRVRAYIESELQLTDLFSRPFAQTLPQPVANRILHATSLPAAFESGQLIADRFRIVRYVADGGMGVVYEAFDEKLRRRIAIKCAKPGFGIRLPPEVRHAGEITHPGVCRIFDIHTHLTPNGGVEFLTMEFLDGRTLADRLREGPLDSASANSIALQLCEGLAEAHRHGVVHGDLKCNNVILVPAGGDVHGRAVITDFGLARRPTLSGDVANFQRMASAPVGGARAYMAPELRKGERQTMASDVYAMGVILRELSSAVSPGVPRRWNRVIARCLDVAPDRRFFDGVALLHALRPSSKPRWLTATAVVIVAASLSGAFSYHRASAPKRTVRLALLPFEPKGAEPDLAAKLTRDAAARLDRLKGSAQVKLVVLSGKDLPAQATIERLRAMSVTHLIRGSISTGKSATNGESQLVHAFLTDAQTGVDRAEWRLRYASDALRYAPAALAGMAAISLDLPPLKERVELNALARPYYTAGLENMRAELQPEKSISLLQQSVAADPGSALAYAGLAEAQAFQARVHHDSASMEQARESVRQAELRNPDLPQVHLISGWLERTSGHYESAIKHFLRAIEFEASNPDAWRRLGQTYGAAGQEGEALEALKKAVQLGPRGFRNHRELGVFYYRHNRFPEAIQEFTTMANVAPNIAESHTLLGEAWYQMLDYGKAESELRAAIQLQDTSAAEQTVGAIFWDQKKDRQAIDHYLRALQLGPETSSVWISLSFCYLEQGLRSKARAAFLHGLSASNKELAQDPRSGRAHATQAYFEAMLHDSARAETDAAESLKLSHDDETIQFAVMTYEAIGRRDLALQLLESSPGVIDELSRYPWLDHLRLAVAGNARLK